MGCICSKASKAKHNAENNESRQELKANTSFKQFDVSLRKEETVVEGGSNDATAQLISNATNDAGSARVTVSEEEKKDGVNEKSTKQLLQRRPTLEIKGNGGQVPFRVSGVAGMPNGEKGAQIVAGWPSWLATVAGEAINGWVPRRAESFEKLDKIGQGTYSSVYRARDLETNKIVALKKVRFANMEPESVRFMAREIIILRRLDHPNVMKLEGLITSRVSGSLYLVFEYMDHDLAGLAATSGIKFTEAQSKGYMQQLLLGLEHCHSHGVLHRDIKGSNLLIDNNGNLKIGDFGLATFLLQKQPLTSRVVTLWYRPPELLLGATEYGVAVDLWSTGCILAEFFAGKPIMPGRTEVEQLHKIFKLCGSPSEEYWKKSKLPHATIFKPQHPYKRCVAETYKDFPSSALALLDVLLAVEPENRGTASLALQSEFFTTKPLPCDPANFPKYQPSKECDANLRDVEAKGQKAAGHKGHGHESTRSSRETKHQSSPDAKPQGQSNPNISNVKHNPKDDGVFMPTKAPAVNLLSQNMKGDGSLMGPGRASENASELRTQRSYMHHGTTELSWFSNSVRGSSQYDSCSVSSINLHWSEERFDARYNNLDADGSSEKHEWSHHVLNLSKSSYKKAGRPSGKESTMGYVYKKNRIHHSGPLMPPGGNLEEMLREHEKRIQEAVRKARLGKVKN